MNVLCVGKSSKNVCGSSDMNPSCLRNKSFSLFLVGIGALLVCMSRRHVYAWYPWRPKEGAKSPKLELLMAMSFFVGAGNEAGSSGRAGSTLN